MTPSGRILNERSGFFGLTVFDLSALAYVLIGAHSFLARWGFDLLAFPVTGLVGVGLISIRLRYRRKIIRDFVRYRIMLGRVR